MSTPCGETELVTDGRTTSGSNVPLSPETRCLKPAFLHQLAAHCLVAEPATAPSAWESVPEEQQKCRPNARGPCPYEQWARHFVGDVHGTDDIHAQLQAAAGRSRTLLPVLQSAAACIACGAIPPRRRWPRLLPFLSSRSAADWMAAAHARKEDKYLSRTAQQSTSVWRSTSLSAGDDIDNPLLALWQYALD